MDSVAALPTADSAAHAPTLISLDLKFRKDMRYQSFISSAIELSGVVTFPPNLPTTIWPPRGDHT